MHGKNESGPISFCSGLAGRSPVPEKENEKRRNSPRRKRMNERGEGKSR
jgi:hypothetical protein